MKRRARRVWAILRREYLVRVRNKWFLISTFGLPLLFLGLVFLPGLMVGLSEGDEPLRMGVVDRVELGGVDLPSLLAEHDPDLRAERVEVAAGASGDELAASLRESDLQAYLVLDPPVLRGEPATLLARKRITESRRRAVQAAVRQAVVQARVQEAGLPGETARELYRGARLEVRVSRVEEGAPQAQEALGILALAGTFVLYMMFLVYGQMIARGVLEEKTSDVAEVLVSTVRPWELMLGKILGIGGTGLTQLVIWATGMGAISVYGLAAGAPALAEMGVDLGALSLPLARMGLAFVLYFLLGYFLYASVFAALGAMVGGEREVQQVAFFPMLLIVVPFMLAFTAVEGGALDAAWMVGGSHFPFFTPILMLVRVVMGTAPGWEIGLSVVVLAGSTLATAWLAGRIYRVGILMKGKRPSLPELVRWVRYG